MSKKWTKENLDLFPQLQVPTSEMRKATEAYCKALRGEDIATARVNAEDFEGRVERKKASIHSNNAAYIALNQPKIIFLGLFITALSLFIFITFFIQEGFADLVEFRYPRVYFGFFITLAVTYANIWHYNKKIAELPHQFFFTKEQIEKEEMVKSDTAYAKWNQQQIANAIACRDGILRSPNEIRILDSSFNHFTALLSYCTTTISNYVDAWNAHVHGIIWNIYNFQPKTIRYLAIYKRISERIKNLQELIGSHAELKKCTNNSNERDELVKNSPASQKLTKLARDIQDDEQMLAPLFNAIPSGYMEAHQGNLKWHAGVSTTQPPSFKIPQTPQRLERTDNPYRTPE